jgi:hypothetical protein
MDALIAASARALAAGDALAALKRIALREDPPALALRGIAMAQLGELSRARELLRRAGRGFGAHEQKARARCVVAEAEVALAMRDFGGAPRALLVAAQVLAARGDPANALLAGLIAVRRLLLLGRLDAAASELGRLVLADRPPTLVAVAELLRAELALRALRTAEARAALAAAAQAATLARVPALEAEVAEAARTLERPAARRLDQQGDERALQLADVEGLLRSGALVIDGCRRGVRCGDAWQSLARRPVLYALVQMLAQAWPGDVERQALIAGAFRQRDPDETHRARLRVELGRLRALLEGLACIDATPRGFALRPLEAREVVLLAPPIDGEQASLLALLSDGAAWSTSALAMAVGASQRTVQRALVELEAEGQVRSVGRARAQRWLAPSLAPNLAAFTTILLLPAALPSG